MLFVIHNETSWNSIYNAMLRVKYFITKKREELKGIFKHFHLEYLRPTEEEFVKEFVKIHQPLAEALDILQADNKMSIGFLFPTLTILVHQLEDL